MKRTVAFQTFGCKLNFSETSTISRDFKTAGYQVVPFEEAADVYVLNTCSVTENADKRFKDTVRKLKEQNEASTVVAIGCLAQLQAGRKEVPKDVDLLLGAAEKFNILNYLSEFQKIDDETQVHACEIGAVQDYHASYSIGDRTRAFLKVQDGCDYKCTYCTIPMARGISRSDQIDNLVASAQQIVSKGVKEIVLTGVNIGDFGANRTNAIKGSKKEGFLDLLQALEGVDGLKRIRISSIEPNLLTDDIIDWVKTSEKIVPHFHIPLQSGTDEVLALMKRRYKTDLYQNRITRIKELIPSACIGADVIVGFPGESEALFQQTYDFIVNLDISYLHVFSYSERANTEAINLPNPVAKSVRSERSKTLRTLSDRMKQNFYQSQKGRTLNVLFEHENKEGYVQGFTDNYVRVKKRWDPQIIGNLMEVKLLMLDEQCIMDCV